MNTKDFVKPHRGSTAQPDHIMLSFSDDPRTTATVTWRTSIDVEVGYMEYWQKDTEDKIRVDAISKVLESDIDISRFFWVTPKNLTPGTKYFYTIGSETHRSDVFSFETEPENLTKFKFIIIADQQNSRPFRAPEYEPVRNLLLQQLEKHPDCKFILTAGDNVDNGENERQWNGLFSGLKGIIESIPFMMCTGNHDNRGFVVYEENNQSGKFYLEHADYFDAQFEYSYPLNGPEGYTTENYSFDYGNVHFLFLGINAQDEVGEWAYEDLQNSDKTWKLGLYHFPIFPIMPEGVNDDSYPYLQKAIENGRLDILFGGHEHSLARTYPIHNYNMYDRPSQGTIHYVLGNSGSNIYCSNAKKIWHNYFYPQEEPLAMCTIVEVDGEKITLTACLDDGRIADMLVIDKKQDRMLPHSLAPIYKNTKMAFKGDMLELVARGIAPIQKDGIWFAAFGVLVQSIGGAVAKEPGKVIVEVYGHKATFVEGSNIAYTSEGDIVMSGEVFRERDQLYIPVEESAKIFEMKWVYSQRNNFIAWEHPSEGKPLSVQP